jgi:hypothetical protein
LICQRYIGLDVRPCGNQLADLERKEYLPSCHFDFEARAIQPEYPHGGKPSADLEDREHLPAGGKKSADLEDREHLSAGGKPSADLEDREHLSAGRKPSADLEDRKLLPSCLLR